MSSILPTLALLGLCWGDTAKASAETDQVDEVRRSQPESYAQGWTNNLTYCADDLLDINDGEFLRTTKSAGYGRLKEAFDAAGNLGAALQPAWVPDGEPRPPPEGPCAMDAFSKASRDLAEMAATRDSLLAGCAGVACEGDEITVRERDALARRSFEQIARFEPVLSRALQDSRKEASPRVRGLITGARKLDVHAEEGFTRCESDYWWRYRGLERLSCQLFVMKNRMAYLSRANEAGERIAFQCFNDAPPAKPEHEDGGAGHLRGSDITGIGTH